MKVKKRIKIYSLAEQNSILQGSAEVVATKRFSGHFLKKIIIIIWNLSIECCSCVFKVSFYWWHLWFQTNTICNSWTCKATFPNSKTYSLVGPDHSRIFRCSLHETVTCMWCSTYCTCPFQLVSAAVVDNDWGDPSEWISVNANRQVRNTTHIKRVFYWSLNSRLLFPIIICHHLLTY